jgi:hypothetical protein
VGLDEPFYSTNTDNVGCNLIQVRQQRLAYVYVGKDFVKRMEQSNQESNGTPQLQSRGSVEGL